MSSSPPLRTDSPASGQPAIVSAFAPIGQPLGVVSRPAGYRMLKSLSVENFRCFERFQLDNLKRINIIVGRNAAGKTALLESIRLAYGATPTVAWTLSSSRGHPTIIQANPSSEQFEAPWRPLFLNLNFDNEIRTAFTDVDGRTATLRMFADPSRAFTPIAPPPQAGVISQWEPSSITPIAFERKDFAGNETTLLATLHRPHPQQQHFYQQVLEPGPELGAGVELFQSAMQVNSARVAQWFSALSIANREWPIKAAIKNEFPFISDLTLQSPVANISVVYATLDYLQQKIPLSFVSSGINKLFMFMSSILTFPNGVILIDELENGLHSSILPHMWEILHRLADQSNTQLFMSTHSWECLKAVVPYVEKAQDEFSLIKIERNGLCAVPKLFSGADLAAALEEEFDFRQ